MEGKDLKRRFVQSTLFPHKESTIKAVENFSGDKEEAAVEEEEEWCGSSQKRRGARKKGNSKLKTTQRASEKKDIETRTGKETSTKQVNASDSPVIPKPNFFVKVSEQRQLKRQQNQLVSVDSPEEIVEICSVPNSAEKSVDGRTTPQKQRQRKKSTPRKEKRSSTPSKKVKIGKRELQFDHISFDLTIDEQPSQKIPDLRLEAKMIAEENTRMFSGRQIHPFFTSWKAGKTSQVLTDAESVGKKEKGSAFNPIHVFENVQDDHSTFNWGHWTFSERSATTDLLYGSSPVSEGSIASLNFDNYMNISQFTPTSLNPDSHPDSRQCPDPQKEVSSEENNSNVQPNGTEDILAGSVEYVLQDHKQEKDSSLNEIQSGGNLDPELEEKLLQERIMSHYHTSHNQTDNRLWTDKYQPQNAKQICGNAESVNFLSEWLQLWQARGSLIIRGSTGEENSTPQDIDCDYQQSESDNDDSEECLKNVLLVSGPVGSGKSAAIYACARDQGFQIIEINASDWRNGALVKQKFGEAVESHWLQRTVENATPAENKSLSNFFKAVSEDKQCANGEVLELIHLSEEDSEDVYSSPINTAYKRTANSQNGVKTLILFEDVDATLSEDHGFITTIQHLSVTAKRPMILTSNSPNPALPKSLGKLELTFSLPSVEELRGLANMICAAEKANIHPCLLQRFVDHCRGDIRRTILLLQFWCQGQALRTGNTQPTTYWPVPFDLDAGHHILPKIIPWDFPSQLSELVAMEVVKSLALMDETKSGMGQIKVDELNNYSPAEIITNKIEDPLEVKKAAMLSFQSLNEVECTPFEADPELFDNCFSPVAFTRQNRQRKVNTVFSSDSEDEAPRGSIPLPSAGEVDEMKTTFYFPSTEMHHPPAEPVFQSIVDKMEENCSQLPEIVDYSLVEDTSRLHETSLMPESTFVPETEIIQETELFSTTVTYCNFFNEVESNWTFQNQDSMPFDETASSAQLSKSFHILQSELEMVGNDNDVTASGFQEEFGDSLSKSEADVPKRFQVLDECSRVDFARNLESLHYAAADMPIDIVKGTWKSLHNQCEDFKRYVTVEERTACKGLTFSHGISNLISEADLLRTDCQTLLHDSLLPLMVPSEKTHSYSYYDNQLEMSSILAQHGMCFYAKEIASLQSIIGCRNNLDLASEMLSSTANSMALGKLVGRDSRKADRYGTEMIRSSIISKSNPDSAIGDMLQAVVPSKSYLAAKGCALHEYISALSQISRYESSRLSNCADNKRNRRSARVPQHYLSCGSLSMSSEEIAFLGRHISCRKNLSSLEISDNT